MRRTDSRRLLALALLGLRSSLIRGGLRAAAQHLLVALALATLGVAAVARYLGRARRRAARGVLVVLAWVRLLRAAGSAWAGTPGARLGRALAVSAGRG